MAHKTRTALAVLSIAIGVFAVGVIRGTQILLAEDLAQAFAATNPADITIQTFQPFDPALINTIRRMRGVSAAEGRRSVSVRFQVGDGEWKNMYLIAAPDFRDMRIDRVRPVDASPWPPPRRQILVERSALGLAGVQPGGEVQLKVPGQQPRSLPVAGTAHDMYAVLYTLDGIAWAYATFETLDWLGIDRGYNEIHVKTAVGNTQADNAALARSIQDKVEQAGIDVFLTSVPEPGQHPLDSTVQGLLLLLGAMGFLSLILGALLVTNTTAALLAEETRAIGIMKAIGATTRQLVVLHGVMVLVFGALALTLALPLAMLATRLFAGMVAGFLNFDLLTPGLPRQAALTQVALVLVVPLLAGLPPILAGTRITVREAIASYGLGRGRFGASLLDRAIKRLRGLRRTTTLALRNTFRRKVRLGLTLTTLTLASAIFMAIFSIRSSALATMDGVMNLWQFDILSWLERDYRVDQLEQAALSAPGITRAEGWGFAMASWPAGEGAQTEIYFGYVLPIMVLAPPPDSQMVRPALARGRWLLPEDENAIVVTSAVLRQQPGVDVGDEITLDMGTRNVTWRIVGVLQSASPAPMAYAPLPYYGRIMGQSGRAAFVAAETAQGDEAGAAAGAEALQDQLERAGIRIGLMSTVASEMREATALFDVLVATLAFMALLLAVVGGLALMGATSLNVIERTREIGVMRSIGAGSGTLMGLFMGEALVTALLSWLLGLALAIPLSKVIGDAVGQAFMQTALAWRFSVGGAFAWLGLVVLLAALASLMPAWRAAQVSVRESLAYE